MHPKDWKLILIRAQIERQVGRSEAARETLARGVKVCADCVPMWLEAAELEESLGNVAKARSLLEVSLPILSPHP